MQKYSSNAIDLFYNSKFAGATVGADVIAKNENKESGEVVKVYLVVRKNTIKSCSFQAMGSINLFACMSTVCELSLNKDLEDAEKLSEKDVINSLKQISKQDYGKVTFAILSLKKAILLYRKKRDRGTLNQRDSRKKEIYPSKNVTIFKDDENGIDNSLLDYKEQVDMVDSSNIDAVDQQEIDKSEQVSKVKKSEKKPVVAKKTEKAKVQKEKASKARKADKKPSKKIEKPIADNTNSELQVVAVGGKKNNKPTRIDVRVVDEAEKELPTISKIITTTTETQKTVDGKVVENTSNTETKVLSPDGKENENMIDEIDTITEQLTNAISQLNFTFDETPEEEQKTKKRK